MRLLSEPPLAGFWDVVILCLKSTKDVRASGAVKPQGLKSWMMSEEGAEGMRLLGWGLDFGLGTE